MTTRGELLAAAEELFAQRGYAAASLADIAAAAGVSKGAVYHHFPSKRDLLLGLLDARFGERIDAVARISGGGASAPQRMIEEIPVDRQWNLLFLEFVILAARDEGFASALRSRVDALREHSSRGIEDVLDAQGLSGSGNPATLATVVAAVGNGLAIEALLHPEQETDPVYTYVLQLLLAGLVAQSSGDSSVAIGDVDSRRAAPAPSAPTSTGRAADGSK